MIININNALRWVYRFVQHFLILILLGFTFKDLILNQVTIHTVLNVVFACFIQLRIPVNEIYQDIHNHNVQHADKMVFPNSTLNISNGIDPSQIQIVEEKGEQNGTSS